MPSFHRGSRAEESRGCCSERDCDLLQTLESCSRKTLELKQLGEKQASQAGQEAAFHRPSHRKTGKTETKQIWFLSM